MAATIKVHRLDFGRTDGARLGETPTQPTLIPVSRIDFAETERGGLWKDGKLQAADLTRIVKVSGDYLYVAESLVEVQQLMERA